VRNGQVRTLRTFLSNVAEFLRDSTPARRRQRYGDFDFDWDHHVDTTGATVSNRDRFLGIFLSPYQPTEPGLFQEMIAAAAPFSDDLRDFTFIDIGSGKGRALLMAADYPFHRIIGVEILPDLHRTAQCNIERYESETKKCFALESICQDAAEFEFPQGPLLIYLFNPLPLAALTRLIANLGKSVDEEPRRIVLLYHNPLLEGALTEAPFLTRRGGTHQYAVYATDVI
jgi:SAM-dependent methyltransferase